MTAAFELAGLGTSTVRTRAIRSLASRDSSSLCVSPSSHEYLGWRYISIWCSLHSSDTVRIVVVLASPPSSRMPTTCSSRHASVASVPPSSPSSNRLSTHVYPSRSPLPRSLSLPALSHCSWISECTIASVAPAGYLARRDTRCDAVQPQGSGDTVDVVALLLLPLLLYGAATRAMCAAVLDCTRGVGNASQAWQNVLDQSGVQRRHFAPKKERLNFVRFFFLSFLRDWPDLCPLTRNQ